MSLKSFFYPPKPINFTTSLQVPALAAGESVCYDIDNRLKNYRKYIPFYTFQIHNNSNAILLILFNYVPESLLKVAQQNQAARRNLPFESFSIKNVSTANSTASDEVLVVIERVQ